LGNNKQVLTSRILKFRGLIWKAGCRLIAHRKSRGSIVRLLAINAGSLFRRTKTSLLLKRNWSDDQGHRGAPLFHLVRDPFEIARHHPRAEITTKNIASFSVRIVFVSNKKMNRK